MRLPLLGALHTPGHRSCLRFSGWCGSYRTCNILFVCSPPSPGDMKFLLIRVSRQVFAAGQTETVSNDGSKMQPWHWGVICGSARSQAHGGTFDAEQTQKKSSSRDPEECGMVLGAVGDPGSNGRKAG